MTSTRDKIRVLVIDSPSKTIEDVYNIFDKEGLTVFYSNDSNDALSKCYEVYPHLLIIEVLSEPMNGLEIVRKIKKDEIFKNISIIMCSDRDDRYDKAWAKEQGVDIYLVKPINKEIVIRAAKKILKSKTKKTRG